MIEKIRHIGIVVNDLEKSLKFYTKKLGFIVSKRMDESGPFIDEILGLKNLLVTTVKMTLQNGQMIELLYFTTYKKDKVVRGINDIGPTHIALTVSELDKIYIDLLSDGIEFISSPKASKDGCVKVAFCRAPEGTFIELVELLKEH